VIAPHREAEPEASAWLDTIPGVSQRPAEIRLADMGTDRARFPTATPRASGAGRCPGHDESGGPRLRGKTRQGRRWRRQVRVDAAHVAATTTQPSLAAQYQRMAARRGKNRARMARGPTIVVLV
jgi:transposase